jgi:8-oxo-dGTP pyrophosphatase MutT (NUDIX family)
VPPTVRAAVLVPLYRDAAGAVRLVIVRRAEGGFHGGQLGFPGGKCEPRDATAFDAALREAREEIGLPPTSVERLADLPAVEVRATGMRIAPFLVRIARPERWRLDTREIAEVLEPALGELAAPEAQGESLERHPGWPEGRPVAWIRIGSHRLWGVSHRILQPLLAPLVAGDWPI